MGLFDTSDVGIDLGTSSILVYVRGRGIVLREPSIAVVERRTGRLAAIGEQARAMVGRTPPELAVVRPLQEGVISHFDVTARMLRYFFKKAVGPRLLCRPRVVICVPSGVTEAEQRCVVEAAAEAGARYCYLIEEPIAAAIGAGVDIAAARGLCAVTCPASNLKLASGVAPVCALLRRGITELAARLRGRFGRRVLGPMTPPVDRIRGEYLAGLLLKVESGASSARARELLGAELKAFSENPEFRNITVVVNVDPQ